MQFFKLVGAFAAGSGGQGRKRTADENVDLLAAKSEAFNKGLRGRAFFYVVNASGGTFTAMAVQKDPRMNMNPQFPAYTEALGVKLTDIHAEEISLHAACNLLHRASRSDYIEDDDDVLKTLDLDYMVNRRFSDFCFREDLMDEACRDEIYAKAGRLFTKDCLLPELDRIYAGGSFGKIVGHPVHYLIQTDDAGIRREMIQSLLPSLYANGRLQNRRYSSVYFRGEALYGKSSDYDQFYTSNAGGTVIVQYSADYGDTDEDTADGIRDTIEKLCSYIKKYRHQVLTILCLPRECTKLKELFYENLGTVSFVELKEEFLEGEQAGDYLKLLARDNHVRTDKKLFAKLEGNRGYLAPELRTIFDGWYNNKLKTTVYPQYKEITTVKTEVEKAKPKGDAYKELINTIASAYNYNTKTDVVSARIRKYESARAAALSGDNIPAEVYDNLVAEVHKNLPAMHRYVELRKKLLGVDKLYMYDMYVPLIKLPETSVSFEEGLDIMRDALQPLGDTLRK